MPTCAFQAGFGVIDEYLNLKEQMEFTAETYDLLDLDQKVPHSDFLAFPDQKCTIKVELNTSEAGMDSYPEYSPQYSLFSTEPYSSCSPLTSSSPHLLPSHVSQPMLGTNSLTTLMSLNSSNSNSSASDSGTTTFVAKDAGSGCTVIQRDQPQTRGDSTELFDLQRPMCDNDFKLVIKAEPQDESQLPQTCQLGGGGVLIRGHGTEDTAMERVLDQLIRNDVQVKEDCKILGISPDPTQWCLDDVQRWVRWICRKHSYKDDCWHLFNVNGLTLCQMGEADFKWRAPEAASCLFHQLEACKLACRFAPEMPISSYPSPPYGGSDVPYLPSSHLHGQPDPSVSPSPSVSSTCSTASCSSSSNGYHHVDNNDDDVFSLARNDTRRQSAAAQLPYPPAPGSRAHPHPPSQRQPKQTIHLWQFLKELLEDPDNYHGCIKWTDRSRGIFKIEDSSKVARLWGRRKNRPAMNYDKLSRSVRQYYKKGIIKKTEHSKRLVYQFCPPYL